MLSMMAIISPIYIIIAVIFCKYSTILNLQSRIAISAVSYIIVIVLVLSFFAMVGDKPLPGSETVHFDNEDGS